MKAIILCAGYGKRMRPYTTIHKYQKTMIPVHGKPLLEYILEGIRYAGFKDFLIVVGYRKEQIINYFKNGEKWGINIEYIEQEKLNGTGGALLLCEELIKDSHFFLTWGDILVPYSIYKEVYETFKQEQEDFVLTANYLEHLQKGCEIHCTGEYCSKMVEKPSKKEQCTNLNNNGIFILSKAIFSELKKLTPSKRGEIEIPAAISNGIKEKRWKVRVIKMTYGTFRGDFGDKKEYERLKEDRSWLNLVLDT
ncbi:MAG: NTP transferase domain-containing protein [Candidatus Lokiarchaeota archaeon]|nr:NTP transferase domain-containing protein [Candidatus Lokiarchaeota archaeon]MBD3342193.1 NTP transferase domain-containing protein [Candidatus Lokiarchaeota archaeon]